MSCKLGDKCDNVFACNILRPNVELLGCNFYKPKKPLTNEEWFCTLSTEEKARVLADNKLYFRMLDYDGFVEWLKEIHE